MRPPFIKPRVNASSPPLPISGSFRQKSPAPCSALSVHRSGAIAWYKFLVRSGKSPKLAAVEVAEYCIVPPSDHFKCHFWPQPSPVWGKQEFGKIALEFMFPTRSNYNFWICFQSLQSVLLICSKVSFYNTHYLEICLTDGGITLNNLTFLLFAVLLCIHVADERMPSLILLSCSLTHSLTH